MASVVVPEESYYGVLDVPFDASQSDIKEQHRFLARNNHPDRRRPGDKGNQDALERFHQVQVAYKCLSNPTRRILYDLRNFGESSLSAETEDNCGRRGQRCLDVGVEDEVLRAKLDMMQKEQADVDLGNMQDSLAKILKREQAKGGIIIRKAIYGDLRLQPERLADAGKRTIEESDLQGPFIDVTQPVQVLVEQHTILINGGGKSSKADLQGFYNPCPLDNDRELELYVLYEFKRKLHEVIVGDRDMLSVPRRAHAVISEPRGPFGDANVSLMLAMKSEADRPPRASAQRGQPFAARTAAPVAAPPSSRKVLERAVVAYRLAGLRERSEESASPREFAIVALCSGVTVSLLAVWARYGGKK